MVELFYSRRTDFSRRVTAISSRIYAWSPSSRTYIPQPGT